MYPQADTVVFYFSGHGAALGGENYLIPYDGTADAALAENLNIACRKWCDQLKRTSRRVVFLDACRNLADVGSRSMGSGGFIDPGFAAQESRGLCVMFGTELGSTAARTRSSGHGLFTAALLAGLERGRGGRARQRSSSATWRSTSLGTCWTTRDARPEKSQTAVHRRRIQPADLPGAGRFLGQRRRGLPVATAATAQARLGQTDGSGSAPGARIELIDPANGKLIGSFVNVVSDYSLDPGLYEIRISAAGYETPVLPARADRGKGGVRPRELGSQCASAAAGAGEHAHQRVHGTNAGHEAWGLAR